MSLGLEGVAILERRCLRNRNSNQVAVVCMELVSFRSSALSRDPGQAQRAQLGHVYFEAQEQQEHRTTCAQRQAPQPRTSSLVCSRVVCCFPESLSLRPIPTDENNDFSKLF